jgi:FkbM family methyltransferase
MDIRVQDLPKWFPSEQGHMKNPNLIYDVGMHKGEDADFYLEKGYNVIGFEADPELARFCRKRFKFQIADGRVRIVDGAISESSERRVKFYHNNERSFWGTVCDDWAQRNERSGTDNKVLEVEVVNFSNVLREYGMPFYMKIDIEGGDMICVNALRNFTKRPDYISIESSKVSLDSVRHELDILESLGYDSFQVVQQEQYHPASGPFGHLLTSPWLTKNETLAEYQTIFQNYIGWYDTHARLKIK